MRRILGILLLALVLGVAALLLAGRDLLVHGAMALVTDDYEVARIEGSLVRTLVLRGVRAEVAGTGVRAEHLAVALAWADLLTGRITVSQLELRGARVEVALQPPDPEVPPAGIRVPALPTLPPLTLADVRVDDLVVVAASPVRIERVRGSAAAGSEAVELDVDARIEGWHARLEGVVGIGPLPHRLRGTVAGLDGTVDLDLELDGRPEDFALAADVRAPIEGELSGRGAIGNGVLEATLDRVRAAPAEEVVLRSDALRLTVRTTGLEASGPFRGSAPGVPEQALRATLRLEAWDRLTADLQVRNPGGDLPVEARAVFSEGTADATLRLRAWAPGAGLRAFGIELPGHLPIPEPQALRAGGTVAVRLQDFSAPRLHVETTDLELTGTPRPVRLRLQGAGPLPPTPEGLEADAEVRAGTDRLQATLRAGTAEGSVRLEDLAAWLPDAAGHLEGTFRLDLEPGFAPGTFAADARAEGVAVPGLGLSVGLAEVEGELAGGADGRLRARLGDARVAGAPGPLEAKLDVEGPLSEPRLRASVSGPALAASAAVTLVGSPVAPKAIAVTALAFETPEAGPWRSTFVGPVTVPLTGPPVPGSPLCLDGPDDARLCVGPEASGAPGVVTSSLRGLGAARVLGALSRHVPTVPPTLAAEGTLEADARLYLAPEDAPGTLRGALSLRWNDAVLVTDARSEDGERIPFPRFALELEGRATGADPDGLGGTARLEIDAGRGERVDLSATVDGGEVDGTLRLDLPRLARYEDLLPGLSEPRGRASAELRLRGPVEAPAVTGSAELAAAATVDAAGVRWEAVRLSVRSEADGSLRVEGRGTAGAGTAEMSGTLVPQPGGLPRGDLELRARDVPFLEVPDLVLHGDAEFATELGADGIRVRGSAGLAHARIRVRALPAESLSLSRDVVIERGAEDEPEPEPEPGAELDLALRVRLGDDVRVEAAGVDARLRGEVRAEQSPGQPLRLYGPVTIADGFYEIYGAELEVTQGRLDFDGPPESPAVTFRARRAFPEQAVGVAVSGRPEALETRLFAEPPLPDSDALTWLLTGRAPGSGAAPGRDELIDAAVSLGLAGTGAVERLRSGLGLDELSLEGPLDSGTLLAGRQLTDRIYVRWTFGLFDRNGGLSVRYELTPALALQTEFGTGQGLELIYHRAFDRLPYGAADPLTPSAAEAAP